jgi:hypothetical protein
MRRIGLVGVWGLCVGMAIGCGGRTKEAGNDGALDADIDIAEATMLSETGCLTEADGKFVLTALETGGVAQTEMYQLVGHDADLSQHIGREVMVTGDAEPAQIAELRETTPAAPVGTSGAGAQPQVATQAQTRFETRKLLVNTITPTGDDCTEPTR